MRPGITNRLLGWFLVVALVPLAFSGYIAFSNSIETIKNETKNKLLSISEHKIEAISTYFNERKKDVATLAHNPTIINSLEKLAAFKNRGRDSPEYRGLDKEFRPFLTHLKERYGLYDLFLISSAGDIVFTVINEEDFGTKLSSGHSDDSQLAKVWSRACTLLEIEVSDFDYYPASDEAAAFVAAPIFKQGEFLGVVAIQIGTEKVNELVKNYTGLGETGEVVIVSRKGNEVVFLTPLRHDIEAAFNRRVVIGSEKSIPIQEAVQGKKGFGQHDDYRGQKVLASWRYLPHVRWGVVVKIDTEEVFASAYQVTRWFLLLGIITLLGVVTVAWLISKTISMPIVRLTETTELMAKGNLNIEAEVATDDEIGMLAQSFNHMFSERRRAEEKLRKHGDHLEDLVSERTKDLEQKARELEEAYLRLQEADRLKSVFLASVSHELRTPLNAIIGFTGIILQGMVGDINEEQRKQLIMVKNSADHLLRLVQDVLDIAEIEAERAKPSVETFALDDVVREVEEAYSPLVKEMGLGFKYDAPEGITLESDRTRLKQLLMTLVSNAVKFTDRGDVKVRVKLSDDENLEICVVDTGVGIKTEDMDKLFQPFRQIDLSHKKRHEGTGLGLHRAGKLADLLGGGISVKSEFGKGSEFIFTLPLRARA